MDEINRIQELIAADTWPQRWSGDEPAADAPFDETDAFDSLDLFTAGESVGRTQ